MKIFRTIIELFKIGCKEKKQPKYILVNINADRLPNVIDGYLDAYAYSCEPFKTLEEVKRDIRDNVARMERDDYILYQKVSKEKYR